MNPEYPSKEVVDEARLASISKSIRLVSVEEMKSVCDRHFSANDPWHEKFSRFISDNAGAKFYHAKVSFHVELVYCYPNNKGIWFYEDLGKGPIQPEHLEMIKNIVEKL